MRLGWLEGLVQESSASSLGSTDVYHSIRGIKFFFKEKQKETTRRKTCIVATMSKLAEWTKRWILPFLCLVFAVYNTSRNKLDLINFECFDMRKHSLSSQPFCVFVLWMQSYYVKTTKHQSRLTFDGWCNILYKTHQSACETTGLLQLNFRPKAFWSSKPFVPQDGDLTVWHLCVEHLAF